MYRTGHCWYVEREGGCTDIHCPRQHPPGYRTRCRYQSRCRDQHCDLVHYTSPRHSPPCHWSGVRYDFRGGFDDHYHERQDFSPRNNNRGLKRARNSTPDLGHDRRRVKRMRTDTFHDDRREALRKLERRNEELSKENANLRLEKDFKVIFDETMQESMLKELSELRNTNRDLSRELKDKENMLDKLEMKREKFSRELDKVHVKCECGQRFISSDILKRHKRFECSEANIAAKCN